MKQIAWLFDVDGVITNPSTKKVEHPEILDFIAERLAKGECVALVTGRGLQWAMKRVAQPLENILLDKKLLDNFFISGEFGGASTTWKNGEPIHSVDSSIRVPQKIIDEAKEVTQNLFSDSNSFEFDKETMISIEIKDGTDFEVFKSKQQELASKLQEIVEKHEKTAQFEVHMDRIGTNIRARSANKYHAAKQVVAWMQQKDFKPNLYLTFGDSLSDTEMTEQIHRMHLPVEIIFVGGRQQLAGKSFDFPVTFTDGHCDDGVVEFIQTFSKSS